MKITIVTFIIKCKTRAVKLIAWSCRLHKEHASLPVLSEFCDNQVLYAVYQEHTEPLAVCRTELLVWQLAQCRRCLGDAEADKTPALTAPFLHHHPPQHGTQGRCLFYLCLDPVLSMHHNVWLTDKPHLQVYYNSKSR